MHNLLKHNSCHFSTSEVKQAAIETYGFYRELKNAIFSNNITCFAAGGSVLAVFEEKLCGKTSLPIKDYDFFFKDRVELEHAKEEFMSKHHLAPTVVYENGNCVGIDSVFGHIELIKHFFGSLKDVLKSFDITVCRFGTTLKYANKANLFCYEEQDFDDLINKESSINLKSFDESKRSKDFQVFHTLYRTGKYSGKGFIFRSKDIEGLVNEVKKLKIAPPALENGENYLDTGV